MRAFVELWDEITRERYGVDDPKMRRFRYGVQVNSLGLTEAQPENNVQRIVLEMLGVTLSKNARARAVQLPAWNEALGLPRPWDQQWSLRLQQVLAFESDLLEYDDIFDGSHGRRGQGRRAGRRRPGRDRPGPGDGRRDRRGRVRLHEAGAGLRPRRPPRAGSSPARRSIVGVNRFETTEPSPLTADLDAAIQAADPQAEQAALDSVRGAGRPQRDEAEVAEALAAAGRRRQDRRQPDGRHPGRRPGRRDDGGVGGHAARGVRRVPRAHRRLRRGRRRPTAGGASWPRCASGCARPARSSGGRLRLLVGKPGLDGHSQRRRAGRRPRPRRRLRGDLPGHPADPRADRRGRGGRGRALRRPLDPVRLAHGAGAGGPRRPARGRARRRAGDRRRHHPRLRRAAGCARPASPRSTRPRTSGSPRSWAASST